MQANHGVSQAPARCLALPDLGSSTVAAKTSSGSVPFGLSHSTTVLQDRRGSVRRLHDVSMEPVAVDHNKAEPSLPAFLRVNTSIFPSFHARSLHHLLSPITSLCVSGGGRSRWAGEASREIAKGQAGSMGDGWGAGGGRAKPFHFVWWPRWQRGMLRAHRQIAGTPCLIATRAPPGLKLFPFCRQDAPPQHQREAIRLVSYNV